MSLKPIETSYRGYRFRSRLEARWAVFFDRLGLRWEYEAQGYELDGRPYLPDFWLPDLQTRVEVKPGELDPSALDEVCGRLYRLSVVTKQPVLLLVGVPGYQWAWDEPTSISAAAAKSALHEVTYTHRQILFMGEAWHLWDVPKVQIAPSHHFFGYRNFVVYDEESNLYTHLRDHTVGMTRYPNEPLVLTHEDWAAWHALPGGAPEEDRRRLLIELDRLYYRRQYRKEHPHWTYGRAGDADWSICRGTVELELVYLAWGVEWSRVSSPHIVLSHPEVIDAADAARSARFEHGVSGPAWR